FQQGVWRLHVDDLRRTRPADGPRAANYQDAMLVDFQGRIVDPPVVVFRAVEHDGTAFQYAFLARAVQVALREFFRDDAGLHNGEIEEIARHDSEPRLVLERLIERPDGFAIL